MGWDWEALDELTQKALSVLQVFAEFVSSRRAAAGGWSCCGEAFMEAAEVHKHVAHTHAQEVELHTHSALEQLQHLAESEEEAGLHEERAGLKEGLDNISAWIPDITHIPAQQLME